MRVLHILEATTGGTRRHLMDLLAHLDGRRFALSLLCATRRDTAFHRDIECLRGRGIDVAEINMVRSIRPLRDLQAMLQIYCHLKRRRPQIVHTHSSKAGFLGRLAARLAGVPAVVHTPHGFAFQMESGRLARHLYVWLERAAARWTDRIVCVSREEHALALRERICPKEKLAWIPNGVAPPAAGHDADAHAALVRELRLEQADGVVGAIGRLTRQKGLEDLLEAVRQVIDRRPGVVFLIAGEGELRPHLEALAARLGIQNSLRLIGDRADVPALYPCVDLVVAPSLWEGLPYTILDAMAAGVCVVASDVGGMRDVVHDGDTGRLLPPHDPPRLAEVITGLLDDPVTRRRLATCALELVQRDYSLAGMIEATTRLYDRLLSP